MPSILNQIRSKGASGLRIVRSARHVPASDWKLLAEASGLVLPIFAALHAMKFKDVDEKLAGMGERGFLASRGQTEALNVDADDPESFPRRASWAVRSVSRRLFPKRPCLTQALALRLMLRRRGLDSTIQIGLRHEDGKMAAHAWLVYQDRTIIGGFGSTQYSAPMVLGGPAPPAPSGDGADETPTLAPDRLLSDLK